MTKLDLLDYIKKAVNELFTELEPYVDSGTIERSEIFIKLAKEVFYHPMFYDL